MQPSSLIRIKRSSYGLSVVIIMILSVVLLATTSGAQDDRGLIVQEVGNGFVPTSNEGCLAEADAETRAFRGERGLLCIKRWPAVSEEGVSAMVAGAREADGISFPVGEIEPSMGQILDANSPNPIFNVEFGAGGYLYSIFFVQSVDDPDFDPQTFVIDLADQHVQLFPERATTTTEVAEPDREPVPPVDECDEICKELLGLLVDIDGWEKLGDPTFDLHLGAGIVRTGEVAEALRSGTRSVFQFYQTDDERIVGVLISRMRFPLFAAAALGEVDSWGLSDSISFGSPHDRPDMRVRGRQADVDAPLAAFRQGRHQYLITTGSSGAVPTTDDLGRLSGGFYDAGPGGETEAFFFASVFEAVVQSALLALGLGLFFTGVRAARGRRALPTVQRTDMSSALVDVEPLARRTRSRSRMLVVVQLTAISALIVGPAVFGASVALAIAAVALVFGVGAGALVRRLDRPGGSGRFILPNGQGLIAGALATALVLAGMAAIVRGVGTWLFTPWFGHLELSEYLAIAPEPLSQLIVFCGVIITVSGAITNRIARRIGKASAEQVTTADSRPHVLYLRSFEDDLLPIPTAATSRRPFFEAFSILGSEPFEETVAWQLEQYGPVIGVLPPGSDRASLGAAKESVPQAEWQSLVLERMAQASTIVLVVAETRGLIWEMDQILRQRFSNKTLFLLPPVGDEDNRDRWNSFREIAATTGLEIDPTIDPAAALVIAIVGERQVGFTAARRDEAGYRAALDQAMSVVDLRRMKNPIGG